MSLAGPWKSSRYRPGGGQCAGFTLIEVMVVAALIVIVSAIFLPNLSLSNDDQAKEESRAFAGLVEYMRDESMLTSRAMAVGYEVAADNAARRSYQFYLYVAGWTLVESDELLAQRTVPDAVRVSWQSSSDTDNRLIIADPSGLVTPFDVSFSGDTRTYRVTVNDYLEIESKQVFDG